MATFDSAQIYIDCATSIKEKIARIDAVIDGLLTSALKAAATGNVSEYELNDGQTQIKTIYRSVPEVMRSIKDFETLKSYYVNKLNGRVMRLADSKNFR